MMMVREARLMHAVQEMLNAIVVSMTVPFESKLFTVCHSARFGREALLCLYVESAAKNLGI